MDYTTQMDAARKGIITKELQAVAEKEQMDTARLMQLVAEGKVASPANKNHKCLDPNGIGSMLKTKINVNLGTSRDCKDLDMELQKVNDAVKMGAESIMDLSSWGDTQKFRRAWEKNVQVIVEGPGHMPLNQIAANMQIQQSICKGAPFYVLGPLVTDIAPGYDHITAAIGGAIAATYGAAFLCYVTPAEHLRLPDLNDVKEGIIASKIAAHAADIAKGVKGASEWDRQMGMARKKLDWEKTFELSIDPEKARNYRASAKPEKEDTCSMCGNFCAVKNMNRILDGEIVSIFDE